jgi:hypothetical protein
MEITLPDDGLLQVTFRKSDGSAFEFADDLLMLRLTCEELEAKHKLAETGGILYATADFLTDLTARLARRHEGLTPTMAAHVWRLTAEAFRAEKKSTKPPPSSHSGMESTPTS